MLHEILTERRRSIGMSIDQLVEKSGVPKGTVTKVLTGVSPNPALETIKSIAYALDLTLNDLVEKNTPELSAEAIKVAMAYDKMSAYGRTLIECVIENEKQYRIVKVVPIMGIAHQDGTIETKYAAKMEQRELAQEENTLNPEKI